MLDAVAHEKVKTLLTDAAIAQARTLPELVSGLQTVNTELAAEKKTDRDAGN